MAIASLAACCLHKKGCPLLYLMGIFSSHILHTLAAMTGAIRTISSLCAWRNVSIGPQYGQKGLRKAYSSLAAISGVSTRDNLYESGSVAVKRNLSRTLASKSPFFQTNTAQTPSPHSAEFFAKKTDSRQRA